MSIDDRLRRAADDARNKVTGLTPPPVHPRRPQRVIGWALAGLAGVMLILFLAPRLGTDSAVEDGTIEWTKEAYDAAFEEFRSCVSDRGGELLNISETEFGTYDYSYRDEHLAIHDACYFALFQDAQIGYESSNEAFLAADAAENRADWEEDVLPCLRANGYDVSGDFETAGSEVPEYFDTTSDHMLVLYMIYTLNLQPRGACEGAGNATEPVTGDLQVVEMGDSGMVLTYPADWFLATRTLTPNLGNPREVFSLGSFPLTPGGPNCAQAPTRALHDMKTTDVFLTIQERTGADIAGLDPRPDRFGPTATSTENALYDCLEPEERADLGSIHWISFTDGGRYLYALVALGRDADPEDASAIWDTLDRMVILPMG